MGALTAWLAALFVFSSSEYRSGLMNVYPGGVAIITLPEARRISPAHLSSWTHGTWMSLVQGHRFAHKTHKCVRQQRKHKRSDVSAIHPLWSSWQERRPPLHHMQFRASTSLMVQVVSNGEEPEQVEGDKGDFIQEDVELNPQPDWLSGPC